MDIQQTIEAEAFLPVSAADMLARGWDWYDFLLVTGDAYVDHPSFGTAVIGRVLQAAGYRVAILAQPPWQDASAFYAMGRPRLGVMLSSGNLDSMVAHYTAAKKRRSTDVYSPGRQSGLRPDRAVIVYANRARQAFPGLPIIIGGLEASLRRFAHYDYWEDKVRRSILADAKADLLVYGMGESASLEIARRLAAGTAVAEITDVRGTAYLTRSIADCPFSKIACPSFEEVSTDKRCYAQAAILQYDEHDAIRGRAIIQPHGDRLLVVNPPAAPLSTAEFDRVYELPYTRDAHPMYAEQGGVAAIDEVRFSLIHNRGCFGGCNFCSLAFHQGRMISTRSHASLLREARALTQHPQFKGYIHDVGGPTANFRHPSCQQQLKRGLCKGKNCLTPHPCPNLNADHSDYLALLQKLRALPGVKKVFVRSGIRFDYLLQDKSNAFFAELVKYHISGQLKVAPEHCINKVLDYMAKPHHEVYERFMARYQQLNQSYAKEQYLVPYLISSHPGSTLHDAIALAVYLHTQGRHAEQVQDFYPTPGTLSTCMYYTGLDPRSMKKLYVPRSAQEKALQRALLQWDRPENQRLVQAALLKAGRSDLIGYGPRCLIRPPKDKSSAGAKPAKSRQGQAVRRAGRNNAAKAGTTQLRKKQHDRRG